MLTLLAGPLFILIGSTGFRFAPLAHGAVVQPAALTLGGVLLGAWVLKDRLTPMRLAGAAVILAGLPRQRRNKPRRRRRVRGLGQRGCVHLPRAARAWVPRSPRRGSLQLPAAAP